MIGEEKIWYRKLARSLNRLDLWPYHPLTKDFYWVLFDKSTEQELSQKFAPRGKFNRYNLNNFALMLIASIFLWIAFSILFSIFVMPLLPNDLKNTASYLPEISLLIALIYPVFMYFYQRQNIYVHAISLMRTKFYDRMKSIGRDPDKVLHDIQSEYRYYNNRILWFLQTFIISIVVGALLDGDFQKTILATDITLVQKVNCAFRINPLGVYAILAFAVSLFIFSVGVWAPLSWIRHFQKRYY